MQKFAVFELSRSMLVINQKRFLIKPRLIWTSSRWWVLLWMDFGWFQIELSIFDFLSNFTGPDLQKFSVFELSRSMLVINQKRFLIKPRLIWTSSRWWVLRTLEGLWMVSDIIVDFRFFIKFHRSGPAKLFSFWTITEHVSYQSNNVPNQAKIDLDFIKMVSITLEGLWMVSDRIVDFRFFAKFHRSGHAKICSFWTITEHVSYQSKKVSNPAKIDQDFMKMVSITLQGLWMVSDRIVDFRLFVKFYRSGPAKIFSFWTITEHVSYPSKKVPNQAKNYLDFIKMVSTTLEGLWMISDRIVDFRFFIKFHRSGPAKMCSSWTITDHVSYQSKKVHNHANIDLDFMKMVSITLEGLWMVSDRIVDFNFFVKFHRSGPAKLSVFELPRSMLAIH